MGFKGFSTVELRKPQRSTFDLSEDKRLSIQMGYLYPVLFKECIPSDSFDGKTEALVRLAPLLAPLYDQIQVYIHYFFVPYRLLWDEWETFITGGQFGDDGETAPPIPPQVNVFEMMSFDPTVFQKSKISDYLGVPLLDDLPNAPGTPDWTEVNIDCMPYVACSKIWYDYFRDRNFVGDDIFDDHPLPLPSGNIPTLDVPTFIDEHVTLRPRAYRHDYFTSALPWSQRGAEVMIPTSITYLRNSELYYGQEAPWPVGPGEGAIFNADSRMLGSLVAEAPWIQAASANTIPIPAANSSSIRIENLDLAGGSGTLVNDWRTAYALQVWLERNAIGGSRYSESIQAHFGVRPQDSRLQRAEYIGGGMMPIKISEQVSIAWSNDGAADVPQANLAGYGVAYGDHNQFRYFCPEHGCIVGMMSIINPPSYHQGLPRYFKRREFLDYPFPTFAKLGEQEVYDYEVYAASQTLVDAAGGHGPYSVFGYQSRYADWKCGRNTSHGDFHDTLLFWSLTSDFGIVPVLSASFVEFDPNIETRIFAAPSVDNFWVYLHNRVFVRRALPYFGTPNNLGFQ